MGIPSEGIEGMYRNPILEVKRFIDDKHKDHCIIYNLCSEKLYDINKLNVQVKPYPFDDHQPPPLWLMQKFCLDAKSYLDQDKDNTVIVHCKAGKGRTGTMICALLLYLRVVDNAEQALQLYAEKRTVDKKGITVRSQKRYVHYFNEYMLGQTTKQNQFGARILEEIRLHNVLKTFQNVQGNLYLGVWTRTTKHTPQISFVIKIQVQTTIGPDFKKQFICSCQYLSKQQTGLGEVYCYVEADNIVILSFGQFKKATSNEQGVYQKSGREKVFSTYKDKVSSNIEMPQQQEQQSIETLKGQKLSIDQSVSQKQNQSLSPYGKATYQHNNTIYKTQGMSAFKPTKLQEEQVEKLTRQYIQNVQGEDLLQNMQHNNLGDIYKNKGTQQIQNQNMQQEQQLQQQRQSQQQQIIQQLQQQQFQQQDLQQQPQQQQQQYWQQQQQSQQQQQHMQYNYIQRLDQLQKSILDQQMVQVQEQQQKQVKGSQQENQSQNQGIQTSYQLKDISTQQQTQSQTPSYVSEDRIQYQQQDPQLEAAQVYGQHKQAISECLQEQENKQQQQDRLLDMNTIRKRGGVLQSVQAQLLIQPIASLATSAVIQNLRSQLLNPSTSEAQNLLHKEISYQLLSQGETQDLQTDKEQIVQYDEQYQKKLQDELLLTQQLRQATYRQQKDEDLQHLQMEKRSLHSKYETGSVVEQANHFQTQQQQERDVPLLQQNAVIPQFLSQGFEETGCVQQPLDRAKDETLQLANYQDIQQDSLILNYNQSLQKALVLYPKQVYQLNSMKYDDTLNKNKSKATQEQITNQNQRVVFGDGQQVLEQKQDAQLQDDNIKKLGVVVQAEPPTLQIQSSNKSTQQSNSQLGQINSDTRAKLEDIIEQWKEKDKIKENVSTSEQQLVAQPKLLLASNTELNHYQKTQIKTQSMGSLGVCKDNAFVYVSKQEKGNQRGCELVGDVRIALFKNEQCRQPLFNYWLNMGFVDKQDVVIELNDLDKPIKALSRDFKMELRLSRLLAGPSQIEVANELAQFRDSQTNQIRSSSSPQTILQGDMYHDASTTLSSAYSDYTHSISDTSIVTANSIVPNHKQAFQILHLDQQSQIQSSCKSLEIEENMNGWWLNSNQLGSLKSVAKQNALLYQQKDRPERQLSRNTDQKTNLKQLWTTE